MPYVMDTDKCIKSTNEWQNAFEKLERRAVDAGRAWDIFIGSVFNLPAYSKAMGIYSSN